jgi:hypothetical protein
MRFRAMPVKSYLSPKTVVRKSAIHGRGLFAAKQIKKGELIGIKGGNIVDRETLKKRAALIGDSYIQIDDDFFLAPLAANEVKKVMMFLNHSCSPNIGVRGQVSFVAMRDIGEGEELTVDYATIDDDAYVMDCNCGTKLCRKRITGKDWKIPALQKKYKGFFSAFVQAKIGGRKKAFFRGRPRPQRSRMRGGGPA